MQNFKLMFAFAFLIILASCKKTNLDVQVPMQEDVPITSQSAANQVRYAETNLKMIGTEIAKLTNDPAFVNFVHAEVNKKFDRQFEVLIGDLKKNPTWSEKLNNSKINEGLNAFKNLEGESFFPHIYLPKFQYDEDENINNTSSRYSVDSILYVFYGGNEDPLNLNGNYKAYYLDDNDSLRVWGEVNEEYANEHEVWVFALNESVDSQGRLMLPCTDDNPCGGGGGGTGGGGGGTGGGGGGGGEEPSPGGAAPQGPIGSNQTTTGIQLNYRINKIKVKYHLENWASGQSEVSIRAWINKRNGRFVGTNDTSPFTEFYTNTSTTDFKGYLIKNFSRKEVRKKTEFTINYNIATSWTVTNFNTDPIIYQYVIFEKDIWPTGDRSSTHTPYTGESAYSSLDAFFSFKSADDEYNLTSFYANKSGMLINIPQAGGNKTYNANNFMTESKENKDGIEYNITNF